MTASVLFLFLLIATLAYLFITEKVSVDLVAVTGLMIITLAGYITPQQAFSGFSSPAIVTMIAMFFVAGALRRTGVAGFVARELCRRVGTSEPVVVAAVMLLAALISGGMNNVAAVAVLLPAVVAISHETKVAASRLLMPLAFGTVLGGMMTAIGTTPNIVMIDVMKDAGLEPFAFLDYTPYGVVAVLAGVAFVAFGGRLLLPNRKIGRRFQGNRRDLAAVYKLSERLFSLKVPRSSLLAGQTLQQSRFGSVFGARVVAIRRNGEKRLDPAPDDVLHPEDTLIVQGRRSRVEALLRYRGITVESPQEATVESLAGSLSAAVISFNDGRYNGENLRSIHFRERYGLVVVGIDRDGNLLFNRLGQQAIEDGDTLRVVGTLEAVKKLEETDGFTIVRIPFEQVLSDKIFLARIPVESALAGSSVKDSRLGELVGVQAVAIFRDGGALFGLSGKEAIKGGDGLLVVGDPERVSTLGMLGSLEVESTQSASQLESSDMILTEIILPPRSRAIGKNLIEINFRERFNFQVLAIWHEGRPYRSDIATRTLRFGDALLVHGPRSKLALINEDTDFVLLGGHGDPPVPRFQSAAAVFALLVVTLLSVSGMYPVHIAAVIGALIVLLTRGLKIEDAYNEVNWKVVFLIAALIPFGAALQSSGGADFLGSVLASSVGAFGFPVSVIVITLVTSLMSQVLDGAVAVVLVAPIAIDISQKLGGDPRIMLMGVALSASIAFITPFSHKASLLVMGAGGYRVKDYARLGTPLTMLVFLVIWCMLLFL
jgi:di/tricarboxylate transporter